MCGITGIIANSKASDRGLGVRAVLDRMVSAIVHRGPDDQGTVVLSSNGCEVGLGHTRLAIIDLSPSGHQPMRFDASQDWITFNGEIYNYEEVRSLIGDQDWKSHSDTEVILAAYQ